MKRPTRFTTGFRLGCAGLLLGGTGCTVTESGTGVLRVSVATTGGDFDLDGYSVVVDGSPMRRVHWNTQADIRGVPSGTHRVGLEGVASNCTANPSGDLSVLVTDGETVAVAFTVICIATGVVITTTSNGLDLDGDGYLVSVDGGTSWSVASNGYTTISRLSPGTHAVGLSGVAANCLIGGANPQAVTVQAGDLAPVAFTASCVAATGTVEVTVATTGNDVDENGYTVLVGARLKHLLVNGTVAFDTVPSGEQQVRLEGAAENCSILGDNPRTVQVKAGGTSRDTVRVAFGVRCVGTEILQVEVATAGVDHDPNGYTIQVDSRVPQAIAVNGTTSFERLGPGEHRVRLGDITGNCTLDGDAERTVVVREGTTTDTVRTAFRLTCAKVAKIAFQSWSSIVVTYADGSNGVSLTTGFAPAWSPDGGQIAFATVYCDYYYYYNCYPNGLAVMTPDGGGFVRLTSDATDGEPVWKPDGSQIAFTRRVGDRFRLHLVNADGSGPAAIPLPKSVQGWNPAWSPDGTRLAFSCVVDQDNVDVCLVNPDGSGLLRLTTDPAEDAGPAWKPDGGRIVFTTRRFTSNRQLAVMNPDGSGVTGVGQVLDALDPAWSPDGTRIAFALAQCGYPCQSAGLFLIAPDGTGLSQLTVGADYAPAWRP